MASTIRLKQEHLIKLARIMEDIVTWKSHSLSPKSWDQFEANWLPSFLQQLRDNEWTVNRTHTNTFKWLEDQIIHCRKLAPGVNKQNAIPLEDTLLGREVIAICQAASRGQLWYDGFAKNSEFHNLFR